jgi:predicted Zn-dependent protease
MALNMMRSEAELAGVLAHEIAHVTQRHIVKAMKIKARDESLTGSIGEILGGTSSSASAVIDQAIDQAVEILFSKGLQREDEFDADKVGIILTAMAGYDPLAYLEFLRRIDPFVGKSGAQLNKTHPPITARIERLEKIINSEGLDQLQGFINIARFEGHYQQP